MQTKVSAHKCVHWALRVGLTVGDAAALIGLGPAAARSWRHLPHLARWLATAGCDKALAQLAAAAVWLAAVWWALGLLTALAATLPGRPGRLAAAACRAVLPHAARKLLAGTAGLGVLIAPGGALALSSSAASAAGIAVAATSVAGKPLPPPIWPTTRPSARPSTGPSTGAPTQRAAPPPAPPTDADARSTVRVRRGDCLWLLAAHRLAPGASDAQIAAYWHRWYAANREVVGTDPDLLHPGEVLHVPAPRAPSSQLNGSLR